MENDEFKDSIEELYKFLREKIITMYGEFLSEEEKKRLYSFDTEKNIVIDNSSRKPVDYDVESKTIIVSDGFITTEYIDRIKLKNDFNLEELKNKINDASVSVLTEELILFSKDLNIKERDIIKSLFIQEILKMVLYSDELSIKDEAIIEGAIELFAHYLGINQGFIVSTTKNYQDVYEVALELKKLFNEDFEKKIFGRDIDSMLMEVKDQGLIRKISKIITDRTILESTQNLDEVIDSINEIIEDINQVVIIDLENKKIVKFIDELQKENLYEVSDIDKFIEIYNKLRAGNKVVTKEQMLRNASDNNIGISLYNDKVELTYVKEDIEDKTKITIKPEDGSYIKEAVLKIEHDGDIDKVDEKEFKDLSDRFKNNSGSLTESELYRMKDYISSDKDMENLKINKRGKGKILLTIVILIATIVVGIFVGWLLFKLK